MRAPLQALFAPFNSVAEHRRTDTESRAQPQSLPRKPRGPERQAVSPAGDRRREGLPISYPQMQSVKGPARGPSGPLTRSAPAEVRGPPRPTAPLWGALMARAWAFSGKMELPLPLGPFLKPHPWVREERNPLSLSRFGSHPCPPQQRGKRQSTFTQTTISPEISPGINFLFHYL